MLKFSIFTDINFVDFSFDTREGVIEAGSVIKNTFCVLRFFCC